MIAVLCAGAQVASADYTPGRIFDDSHRKTGYKDSDWNVQFYENCDLPEYSSVGWVREGGEKFLRFTLKNGHVGRCGRDHVYRSGAPYHERAEIKQAHTLTKGVDYSLTYRARILHGVRWHRESIMQVTQGVRGCRKPPLIKLEFRNGHLRHATTPVHVDEILGKWMDVRFDFNTEKSYDLYFEGRKVIDEGYYFTPYDCGEPHLKFGIYRPGDPNATGDRLSVMDIDKVRLVER